MHHRKSGKKLSRHTAHRKAMFRNMSASLLKEELIKTTVIKAKELRRFVEPLITLAKNDSVANRRLAFSRLRDNAAAAAPRNSAALRSSIGSQTSPNAAPEFRGSP